MGIKFDLDRCIGCGACVSSCPYSILEIKDSKVVSKAGCTLCGACIEACPENAISIEDSSQADKVSEGYQGVWVFAEQKDGRLKSVSFELLAKGRELAEALQTELCAVCLGHNIDKIEQLVAYGADKVYLVDSPELATNAEDLLSQQLIDLIKQYRPEVVLAGATALGRSFIPRAAAVLETGLTADCTGLEIDIEKRLLRQTRPTFGGNIMATILCPNKRPQMATVRPRTFKKSAPGSNRKGQIIKLDFKKESITSRTRLINFVDDISEKIKLEEADIVVSGGRGLEKPENFKLIEELAQCLGAAVGSSRPPVDEGWISYSHQVGQTGKTVCPKLYIACGISGSVQHMAGMQTADTIVAINSDPNAPIFEIATYGIVGDLFKVLPLISKRINASS